MNDLYLVLWDLAVGEARVVAELDEVGLDGLGDVAECELLVHDVGDLRQVLLGLGVEDDGGDVCVQDRLDPPCDLAERGQHGAPGLLEGLVCAGGVGSGRVDALEPPGQEPKEVLWKNSKK